jgi:hypothetical protein
MSGRSVRSLCLVTAVWAMLFAPGSFRGDASAVDVTQDAHRLAAAVIAPTFDADGLHAARPCRDEGGPADACDAVVAFAVPAGVVVLLAAGLPTLVPGRRSNTLLVQQQRSAPPRAPPSD